MYRWAATIFGYIKVWILNFEVVVHAKNKLQQLNNMNVWRCVALYV